MKPIRQGFAKDFARALSQRTNRLVMFTTIDDAHIQLTSVNSTIQRWQSAGGSNGVPVSEPKAPQSCTNKNSPGHADFPKETSISGAVRLSEKERHWLELYASVKREEITLKEASELVRVSYRQAKRSGKSWNASRTDGIAHWLRGQQTNREVDPKNERNAIRLYTKQYNDSGLTSTAEYLNEVLGVVVSVTTIQMGLGTVDEAQTEIRSSQLKAPRRLFVVTVRIPGSPRWRSPRH